MASDTLASHTPPPPREEIEPEEEVQEEQEDPEELEQEDGPEEHGYGDDLGDPTSLEGESLVPPQSLERWIVIVYRHTRALSLVSKLQPEEVLVLDAVWSTSYRGRLAVDEPVKGKLETRVAQWQGGVGAAKAVVALAPPGSVVDGLGVVVFVECEIRGKAASMVVTWPAGTRPAEFGVMRRVAVELGIDTAKITARVSGRAELDALYT
nr:uncharacterized protein LOC117835515 [Setaria viridis]